MDDDRKKLIGIMERHNINSAEVGRMLDVKPQYIRAMRCGDKPVTGVLLRLLEHKVGDRSPSHPGTAEEIAEALSLDGKRRELIGYEFGQGAKAC